MKHLIRALQPDTGVVMNSWTHAVAVRRIGPVPVPEAPEFLQLLHRAYEAEPPVAP